LVSGHVKECQTRGDTRGGREPGATGACNNTAAAACCCSVFVFPFVVFRCLVSTKEASGRACTSVLHKKIAQLCLSLPLLVTAYYYYFCFFSCPFKVLKRPATLILLLWLCTKPSSSIFGDSQRRVSEWVSAAERSIRSAGFFFPLSSSFLWHFL
jgi:hypothetical protein